jgi:DNA-binding IclR family transcriptional regulator
MQRAAELQRSRSRTHREGNDERVSEMAVTELPVEHQPALRGLSTARSVLQALRLLAQHPEGVRADRVAAEVDKSLSTAYHLLASLCDEGFAERLEGGLYRSLAAPLPDSASQLRLTAAVERLFFRTRKRSYLGVIDGGSIEIAHIRGRQGVACMPGLGTRITPAEAHSLAMGKVVLALLPRPALERHMARGLARFTEHTLTHPRALAAELDAVRADGFAIDREERTEDFCCIAAPMFDARGRLAGVLGLSATAHVFDAERKRLAPALLEVARAGGSWVPGSSSDPRASCAPAERGEELPPSALEREE